MRVEYISCVGCTQTHSYKYRLQSSSTNENIFLTKTTRTHSYVLYMCIRRSMPAITVNRLPFTICRAQIKAKWIRINKLCKCRNWVSRHPTPERGAGNMHLGHLGVSEDESRSQGSSLDFALTLFQICHVPQIAPISAPFHSFSFLISLHFCLASRLVSFSFVVSKMFSTLIVFVSFSV